MGDWVSDWLCFWFIGKAGLLTGKWGTGKGKGKRGKGREEIVG